MGRMRRNGRDVNGILLLDKPVGTGSNEVLQIVKRLYQARKAGHTGSLDRLACGLLPICLGEATKMSGFLLNADKRYQALVRLGEKSSTGDAEGEIIERRPVPVLSPEQVNRVLEGFHGEIEQIPPMHSAVKIQGQRLYKLAHRGLTIEREPRRVTIRSIAMTALAGADLHIDVLCTKGTYIRTLAEDIGEALGCGARIEALRRTASGPFSSEQMVGLETLGELAAEPGLAALDGLLLPMQTAVAQWPDIHLSESVAYYLRMGQAVLVPRAPTSGMVRLYRDSERFIGVGEVLDDGRIAPRRLVNTKR